MRESPDATIERIARLIWEEFSSRDIRFVLITARPNEDGVGFQAGTHTNIEHTAHLIDLVLHQVRGIAANPEGEELEITAGHA